MLEKNDSYLPHHDNTQKRTFTHLNYHMMIISFLHCNQRLAFEFVFTSFENYHKLDTNGERSSLLAKRVQLHLKILITRKPKFLQSKNLSKTWKPFPAFSSSHKSSSSFQLFLYIATTPLCSIFPATVIHPSLHPFEDHNFFLIRTF